MQVLLRIGFRRWGGGVSKPSLIAFSGFSHSKLESEPLSLAFGALWGLTPACRATFSSSCPPQWALCPARLSSLLGADLCCGLANHSPKAAPPSPRLSWESPLFSHAAMIHPQPATAPSGLRTLCPYASLHPQAHSGGLVSVSEWEKSS